MNTSHGGAPRAAAGQHQFDREQTREPSQPVPGKARGLHHAGGRAPCPGAWTGRQHPTMTAGIEASARPVIGDQPRRVDTARVAELYRQLLIELGEDPGRDGLRGTPGRVAAWWSEFLDYDPGATATVFDYEPSDGDHLLVVGGVSIYSLCEHHLLPMRLAVTIGYLPAGQALGLSKFARIAQAHARRLPDAREIHGRRRAGRGQGDRERRRRSDG